MQPAESRTAPEWAGQCYPMNSTAGSLAEEYGARQLPQHLVLLEGPVQVLPSWKLERARLRGAERHGVMARASTPPPRVAGAHLAVIVPDPRCRGDRRGKLAFTNVEPLLLCSIDKQNYAGEGHAQGREAVATAVSWRTTNKEKTQELGALLPS